jgi:hypothetical protein
MCNDCEDRNLDNVEEQELAETGYISGSYDNSFLEPLEIPLESYDTEKFFKGVEDFSELAGKITALVNVGIHPSEALGYIVGLEGNKCTLEIAKITKEMNIEMSKNQIINFEKNQL